MTRMKLQAVEIKFVQIYLNRPTVLRHSDELIKNAKIEMQNYANDKGGQTVLRCKKLFSKKTFQQIENYLNFIQINEILRPRMS